MSTATDAELVALGERFEKLLLEYLGSWLNWAPDAGRTRRSRRQHGRARRRDTAHRRRRGSSPYHRKVNLQ
jgi:hypothetical protein